MSPPSLSVDTLIAGMRPVLARFPQIAAAWLFGSAVRGQLRAESDVDVGIILPREVDTAVEHYAMLGELAARLEAVTTPHPVDVVVLGRHDPIFAHEVLCSGRLVHEADRERRIDFEVDIVRRALDFRPTYELALQGQAEGLRRRLRIGQ